MTKAAYKKKQLSELTVLDGGVETKSSHLDPQAGNREQSWNDIRLWTSSTQEGHNF